MGVGVCVRVGVCTRAHSGDGGVSQLSGLPLHRFLDVADESWASSTQNCEEPHDSGLAFSARAARSEISSAEISSAVRHQKLNPSRMTTRGSLVMAHDPCVLPANAGFGWVCVHGATGCVGAGASACARRAVLVSVSGS